MNLGSCKSQLGTFARHNIGVDNRAAGAAAYFCVFKAPY